jgi:hypothetical protein
MGHVLSFSSAVWSSAYPATEEIWLRSAPCQDPSFKSANDLGHGRFIAKLFVRNNK